MYFDDLHSFHFSSDLFFQYCNMNSIVSTKIKTLFVVIQNLSYTNKFSDVSQGMDIFI